MPVGSSYHSLTDGKSIGHITRGFNVYTESCPIYGNQIDKSLMFFCQKYQVTDRMVCAGHGGAKRIIGCHGDSGGPFVCKTGVNGTWVLHGAVSWGSGRCDATKAYTVFARVAYFRDWINLNIRRYSSSGCTNPNFS